MHKSKIPKALREQVWLKQIGKRYEGKCSTVWCTNMMSVFDFQCGHDIPESKGGETILQNLHPICSRCNLSMSNTYTLKEWNQLSKKPIWCRFLCFRPSGIKENGSESISKNMNQNGKHITSYGTVSKIRSHPEMRT